MSIFRAYWKRKGTPKEAIPTVGFVKATDEKDAKRIVEENLDSHYEVTDVTTAEMHMVTPQSITINFRNTAEYHYG